MQQLLRRNYGLTEPRPLFGGVEATPPARARERERDVVRAAESTRSLVLAHSLARGLSSGKTVASLRVEKSPSESCVSEGRQGGSGKGRLRERARARSSPAVAFRSRLSSRWLPCRLRAPRRERA